ncbi:MAG: hypothetical protein JNK30_11685 [Phenylobacterium sp.]|uniref:hypothetical protein n=1 Tax=Phenylobacterium sp. TaxID=1871053 RepID=UPI001A59D18F|nr:hypothetical protein [Phenylobacterium sp.]MBL8772032.1 hypothetical protein [Phenylobacterium sp.]
MPTRATARRRPEPEDVLRVISPAFDPDFYRAIYTDLPADMPPLWHYRMAGWREGRDPAPWFSAPDYLADNPEVQRAGWEPLHHYLSRGRREGREVRPSRWAARYFGETGWAPPAWSFKSFGATPAPAAARPAIPLNEQEAAIAAEFDAAFYLAANPDIAAAGMDPLRHFLRTGWLEGRDPNPRFSVRDYLELHPDIAAAGVNPFAHFLLAGRAEGRAARHDLGFRYDVLSRLKSPEDRIAESVRASAAQRADPPERLAAPLAAVRDLHLTFSHDDYIEHSGGLQSCLRRESARVAQLGRDHLHLFPAAAWPSVRAAGEPGPLGALLNGRRLGVFAPETVREVLSRAAPAGRRSFAVHSLLGHEPDATADIVEALGLREGFFWLHDFASLCSGFHLQRNDVEDCGAPAPGSAACTVCAYSPTRARHLDAHARLFERLRLTVVAPSQTTLDFWSDRGLLRAEAAVVLPHAGLVAPRPAAEPAAGRPFRLAYLGMPQPLKGWPIFRELTQAFAGDPRYEFLHLGGRPDPGAYAQFHRVIVTPEWPTAMQDTLTELEPDAALIWPLCRETFSFTAYEAAAAGAAVVTGPDSGNVAAFAADPRHGRVLADEAALFDAFATGEILALSRAARRAEVFDIAYSGMTGDLVAEAP